MGLPTAETACFVIADISGYTRYLSGVELDHAEDILADLIGTIVGSLHPPFRLAKLEGDAAFFYAPGSELEGLAFQDAIDAAYMTFRRRLRDITHASVCTCQACHRMGDLDLKFVSHHGAYVLHSMAGLEELSGRDVILVHRLLKNGVPERLSGHAYALFTDASVAAMGIDAAAQGLIRHSEEIEHLGEVTCWVRDLEAAWKDDKSGRRVMVEPKDAAVVREYDLAAPRPLVWDHFNRPDLRVLWRATNGVDEAYANGRRGAGTVIHCMHGADVLIEEILDWRPYDYVTQATILPAPDAPRIPITFAFSESEGPGGPFTRFSARIARLDGPAADFVAAVAPVFALQLDGEIETLRSLLADALSQAPGGPETAAPVSASRFLTEPVTGP